MKRIYSFIKSHSKSEPVQDIEPDYLRLIPKDVLKGIVWNLSYDDATRLSLTSKYFHSMIEGFEVRKACDTLLY